MNPRVHELKPVLEWTWVCSMGPAVTGKGNRVGGVDLGAAGQASRSPQAVVVTVCGLSTVTSVDATSPWSPIAYTVCGPGEVPPGRVTLTSAVPLAGTGEGVTVAASTVPLAGSSSRKLTGLAADESGDLAAERCGQGRDRARAQVEGRRGDDDRRRWSGLSAPRQLPLAGVTV